MRKMMYGCVLVCAAGLVLVVSSACAGSREKASVIDPAAKKVVKALSKTSQSDQLVRYKVYDTSDEVTETGEIIQYGHVRTVVLRRPDRLMMETRGDRSNTTLWYDGSLFTLLDSEKNVYAQLKAPATLDETIDMVYDRYGISTPLADMLSGDIYAVLMDSVITCRYLGLGLVGERKCHHIAATQKDVDWQAWIDQGDRPHLRKLVITYKQLDESPRYSVMLVEAEALTSISPGTFIPQLPEGAAEVEPIPREEDDKSRL